MKIVEYQLADIQSVQEYISNGWEPWGSPIMQANYPYQAMVRYEEEPIDTLQTMPPISLSSQATYNPHRPSHR